MEGPQFSTRAESNLYRSWGCDVIGMTNMPEAKLAREAEICYATVAMVTDYDCWHADHAEVDVAAVIKVLHANVDKAHRLIERLARDFPRQHPPCPIGSDRALDVAIITPPDARDPALLKKLDAVAGRVLGGKSMTATSNGRSTRPTPSQPVGGYAQAVEVGSAQRLLFVSGQIPVRADGTLPQAVQGSGRLAWANVEAQLRAAGMSFDNLVKVTIFLSDRAYGLENRAMRREVIGDGPIALTVIITGSWLVAALVSALPSRPANGRVGFAAPALRSPDRQRDRGL